MTVELYPCPGCQQSLAIAERFFGKMIRCPQCQVPIQLQALTQQAATTPPSVPQNQSEPPPVPSPSVRNPSAAPPRRPHKLSTDDLVDEGERTPRRRRPRKLKAAEINELKRQPLPRRRKPDKDHYDDEDDLAPPDSDEPTRPLHRVRTGITFVLVGILLSVLTFVVAVVGAFIVLGVFAAAVQNQSASQNAARPGGLLNIFAVTTTASLIYYGIVLAIALCSVGFHFFGNLFFCGAPRKGGKISAIISLILLSVWLVLFVGTLGLAINVSGIGSSRMPTPVAPTMERIIMILGLVGIGAGFLHVFFLEFFLRSMAKMLHQRGTVVSVTSMMIFHGVTATLHASLLAVTQFTIRGQTGVNPMTALGPLAAAAGCLVLVLWLAWVIWFVVNLFVVRSAVSLAIR